MINERIYVKVLWQISKGGRAGVQVKFSIFRGNVGCTSPIPLVYDTLKSYRVLSGVCVDFYMHTVLLAKSIRMNVKLDHFG